MVDELNPAQHLLATVGARGLSRRRVLQAAGLAGVVGVAAACGADSSGSTVPSPSDRSKTDKVVNFSNWPLYIDDEALGDLAPTMEAFTAQTGITINYTADVNDNNDFYAKVRTQLETGQDTGRDIVVLTDWMAGIWITNGYAVKFDKSLLPNAKNLIPKLQSVPFDPQRDYTMPWQSGFGGLGWNIEGLKAATGWDQLTTLDQLFDPKLKGRMTVLSEMRDTMGCILAWQGANPTDFTDVQWANGIDALQKLVDSGQIRSVSGNDYIAALESKDVIACIGWSGDVFALGDAYGFALPESGGTLWTDNMLIPAMAQHQANAEAVINYYYDPKVAAQLAVYVNYICPVEGAQAQMETLDPELASSPWIFPDAEMLKKAYVFMPLSADQEDRYQRDFQKAIGN